MRNPMPSTELDPETLNYAKEHNMSIEPLTITGQDGTSTTVGVGLSAYVQPEFKDFGKITRYRTLTATVTEKIDGANVHLYIPENPDHPIMAGSRNRWVFPEKGKDNFGFAQWVLENDQALRSLGIGRHYGEWWGAGIQRKYGLDHKRLSLFNHDRFTGGVPSVMPENVSLVPILYKGPVDTSVIQTVIDKLYAEGSVAAPGWTKPEGVVITIGGQRYKVTDNGDVHKGQVK
jgi:hypothetical protein